MSTWRDKAIKNGSYFKEGRATFLPTVRAEPSRQVRRRIEIIACKGEPHTNGKVDWREIREVCRS